VELTDPSSDGGITRREILRRGAVGAAAIALVGCGGSRRIEGRIVGASAERGHRLRSTAPLPAPSVRDDVPVVVVGGGVAGLSAAWRLARAGATDHVVLELEDRPGGTAAYGENAVSRYPLGAHYLPRPTSEQRALCELLREAGILTGFDARGRALVAEGAVCRDPEERLFEDGAWQEGLFPRARATTDDLHQFERFRGIVDAYAARRDDAGRRAFAIPTAASARDADLLALDAISAAEWLARNAFTSPALRWYVEYACRDDFGASLERTSAWAALHYFASRVAVPGDEAAPLLTWPEGNGRLVDALAAANAGRVRTGIVVLEIRPAADRVVVTWWDEVRREVGETTAEHVVCALPRFAARRVVRGLEAERGGFSTSPWVVANVTLDAPAQSEGFPLAWDNVIHGSDSLGYVDATHQRDRRERGTVWTWYRPFAAEDPAAVRTRLLEATWEAWRDSVLADLGPVHRDFERHVVSIDVARWGHGMVRPEPGFLFGPARAAAAAPLGRVRFAGADLGGLPLFEEAQWSGVRAAEQILAARGVVFESWA
jgi:protoporphyrinogen oxidase